jgi:Rrf2 family cysteine metabolism transcriptional repressor
MKLSTRTHSMVQALLDSELHYEGDSPVPLKKTAQRQGISHAYLEQMITPLIAGGIIRSIRGPKGGVVLTKPAKDINLKEIVEILEGATDPVECLVNAKICPRSGLCTTRDIWGEMKTAIDRVFVCTNLQDLAERQKNKEKVESTSYI